MYWQTFLKDLFIWETEKERRKEGGREIFHPLFHSPKWPLSRGWTRLKPEAECFFHVSHMHSGIRALGPSSIAFQSALTASWIESRAAAETLLAPIWNAGIAGSGVIYYVTKMAAVVFMLSALSLAWLRISSTITGHSYFIFHIFYSFFCCVF